MCSEFGLQLPTDLALSVMNRKPWAGPAMYLEEGTLRLFKLTQMGARELLSLSLSRGQLDLRKG